jgi:hypothetical protein
VLGGLLDDPLSGDQVDNGIDCLVEVHPRPIMFCQLLALREPYQVVEHVTRAHLRHHQGHRRPTMDAELHHISDAVGIVQEALLPVPTVGEDVPCRGLCGLLDPQQLRLQLCSTHEHDEWEKQIQVVKPERQIENSSTTRLSKATYSP